MDDSGSVPKTPEANERPAAEQAAPMLTGAHASGMVRARSVPTSTLVLGAILLVVVAFLGGWVVGHHAARQADRNAFASFARQHDGFGSRYGQGGFGGFSPGSGSGYGPGYGSGTGSWCAPCYGSTSGVAVPCSTAIPGYAPGSTGSCQTVPTAAPGTGTGGSQGSGS